MSNNSFLSNYGKDMGESEPAAEVAVRDADLGYKYEEKSGFRKYQSEDGGYPPLRRPPKFLIPAVAAGVVVIAVVITLVLVLGGGIKVIDLVGKSLGDAQLWSNQTGVMLDKKEEYNNEYAVNTVIKQSVDAGNTIRKGEFLTITVSLGHDLSVTLPLPDLMSMTMSEVEAWRDNNFMTKVRITTEFSETVPEGNVIRFEVNDDSVTTEIRRDTPVYVIVSKGKDTSIEQVTVPDFKTMTISEAYIFANENGINLVVEEVYDDYVPKGSVISQSVKATEKIGKGGEIKLVFSKGKMIEMPDFSDYTKEQAAAVAAGLGIPVTVIEQYSGSSAGRFLSQSIKAGTIYDEGDQLELKYSLGNKIALASFVGQTRDAIESWASELNKQGASIKIKVTTTQSSQPKGTIIYQDVANKMIGVKTTIRVTVSLGKILYVPDFVIPDGTITDPNRGYDVAITREEAIAMCEAVGLVPVFIEENKSDRLPGEVWYQSVAAGSEVSEGSKITLKYVPSAKVTVNIDTATGLTKEQAKLAYGKLFTLVFEDSEEIVAPEKIGKVVGQSIPNGTTVTKGTTLTLYIGAITP